MYVTGNGVEIATNETSDVIPDSSEFERLLLEESKKQQNGNSNTPAAAQTSQITDVNMLFTQMNLLGNGTQ